MGETRDEQGLQRPKKGFAKTLQSLRYRWWSFFYKRCLIGFPWFCPARTANVPTMVAARRYIRRHFGRDHHPVYRALEKSSPR